MTRVNHDDDRNSSFIHRSGGIAQASIVIAQVEEYGSRIALQNCVRTGYLRVVGQCAWRGAVRSGGFQDAQNPWQDCERLRNSALSNELSLIQIQDAQITVTSCERLGRWGGWLHWNHALN
jgi:hypothetical protein